MFPEILWAVPPAAVSVPVGAAVWRNWSPASWNYGPGLVGNAARVHLTWADVSSGCGLTKTRTRLGKGGRRQVERKPKLSRFRPTGYGFRVRVRLHDGQTPGDYAQALTRLAHSWRVHAVRVRRTGPGWVELVATSRDPLVNLGAASAFDGELLTVQLGRLETGEPWVVDFRQVPHWLDIGATQSGKSTDVNALIKGLSPQPVALAGLDLKGGVELTPYEDRISKLATTRDECGGLLDDLIGILTDRMALCRTHRMRNVWKLPEDVREQHAMPIVVFVDEVAELYLMADKSEKDVIAKTSTTLLRIAQLGRAFAVYLVVCGQRVGSDLGPGVTALRSQLSGRICHRVNDAETAKMALGDLAPDSLEAALSIPAEMPGVAVTVGADGRWHRARSFLTTEEEAEQAAREFAHLAPSWDALTTASGAPSSISDAELADFLDGAA
ncbi:FtsK/SpoIIIE domain-containing protein [Actinorugispora endophytica]|uniref:S-DNA-T family DNA segregation ATPase FtsK/SpoIIIE n=1 Tax=Actinorugispora endophytica TaxID=1605990 RepID=A0A4R6UHX2_9ACTN|nr:FtsK/SpoIIIE domain-containing protein [Actinorugispora endophytica]TDQ46002.1 S-DNA-T family DNA segregation ATPase FtsK/SpoIIIE [Actinorugispora endophytica]